MTKNEPVDEDSFSRCLMIENDRTACNNNEDFCTICQKHFCNKYYLKKHKLDVHKMLSTYTRNTEISYNQALNDNRFSSNDYNFDMNCLRNLFVHMNDRIRKRNEIIDCNLYDVYKSKDSATSPKMMESSLPFSTGIFDSSILKPKLPSDVGLCNFNFSQPFPKPWYECHQCNMRFSDESGLFGHYRNVHETENYTTNKVFDSKKHFFQNAQFLSNHSLNNVDEFLSSNTLDAFKYSMVAAKLADRVICDICGKDLCNKYFLRTHRKKVHGIKIHDTLKSGILCRTLPINSERLDTEEDRNKTVDYSEIKEMSVNKIKSDIGNQTELPSNVEDNKSLKIISKYPLSTLSYAFHNKQYMFDSKRFKWIKQPVANKVKCDICDRLICNKYFLKTHKYKKHGIEEYSSLSNTDINIANIISTEIGYLSNVNDLPIYGSVKSFNSLNTKIPDMDNEKINISTYRSQILSQKEEPLDLSLPKSIFPVCSSYHFRKNVKKYQRKISSQSKNLSSPNKKHLNRYKKLINKYFGFKKTY